MTYKHRGEINAELGNTTWGGGGVELIYFRTRPQVNKKVPNYMRFFGVFGVGYDFFLVFGVGSDLSVFLLFYVVASIAYFRAKNYIKAMISL